MRQSSKKVMDQSFTSGTEKAKQGIFGGHPQMERWLGLKPKI
jgi:hypothetical protein